MVQRFLNGAAGYIGGAQGAGRPIALSRAALSRAALSRAVLRRAALSRVMPSPTSPGPAARGPTRADTYERPRRNGRTASAAHIGASLTETTDVTLSALMAASQNGDARAYQALLRACVPFAATIARRQGVPADRVEDVVQEILLTIHRARATYDPLRPFLPWLRAIAQRRAIDALRSRYRQGTLEVQDDEAAREVGQPRA